MIHIPMKRISYNANNYALMKTVGIHIVTPLFCICRRGWVETYSQNIAQHCRQRQLLLTRVITGSQAIFTSIVNLRRAEPSHPSKSRNAKSKNTILINRYCLVLSPKKRKIGLAFIWIRSPVGGIKRTDSECDRKS